MSIKLDVTFSSREYRISTTHQYQNGSGQCHDCMAVTCEGRSHVGRHARQSVCCSRYLRRATKKRQRSGITRWWSVDASALSLRRLVLPAHAFRIQSWSNARRTKSKAARSILGGEHRAVNQIRFDWITSDRIRFDLDQS